ncbi:MAG: hypothetical protein KBC84_09940 [Proteobacteria bacterium]|nr:hypothetical protein [Pseudomonadota bacterium]
MTFKDHDFLSLELPAPILRQYNQSLQIVNNEIFAEFLRSTPSFNPEKEEFLKKRELYISLFWPTFKDGINGIKTTKKILTSKGNYPFGIKGLINDLEHGWHTFYWIEGEAREVYSHIRYIGRDDITSQYLSFLLLKPLNPFPEVLEKYCYPYLGDMIFHLTSYPSNQEIINRSEQHDKEETLIISDCEADIFFQLIENNFTWWIRNINRLEDDGQNYWGIVKNNFPRFLEYFLTNRVRILCILDSFKHLPHILDSYLKYSLHTFAVYHNYSKGDFITELCFAAILKVKPHIFELIAVTEDILQIYDQQIDEQIKFEIFKLISEINKTK